MVAEMAALPLAVMVVINIVGAQDVYYGHPENYKPHLTTEDIGGKITASTFVLAQPRCVFKDTMDTSEDIWLVVAKNDAENHFKPSSPGDWGYHAFYNNEKPYYMTLDASIRNYPCPGKPGELTLLRVGSETDCVSDTIPDCNGPLPGPGPYKVKFVAMREKDVTVETEWSDPITLIRAENYTMETAPKRLSVGSIVIAAILSILSAILLAALISALVYKYSDVCGNADIGTINEPTAMTRYTTHNVYDHPPYKT